MEKSEEIEGLEPEQYGSQVYKAADIKVLNTALLYDLIRIK